MKAEKYVRHKGRLPHIENEGIILKEIVPNIDPAYEEVWHRGLSPWQRMNAHHTLASVRKHYCFIPTRAPKDKLDFVLSSQYQHNEEIFPETVDVVLQHETVGEPTWRRLKNNTEVKPVIPVPLSHPLLVGGITEKRHPHNVKLMNSSHHSPQTNAGYVRQDRDGNIFFY